MEGLFPYQNHASFWNQVLEMLFCAKVTTEKSSHRRQFAETGVFPLQKGCLPACVFFSKKPNFAFPP
jgi:hypothetical protein